MSRLLFAAARGARIEYGTYCRSNADGYEWVEGDNLARMRKIPELYRIHPDDAHLQYGPISTALRIYSDKPFKEIEVLYIVAKDLRFSSDDTVLLRESDQLHRSLFLLILAESLADSGL